MSFSESGLSDKLKDILYNTRNRAGEFKYVRQIDEMMANGSTHMVFDYSDLVRYEELERHFRSEPDLTLKSFGRAVHEILRERHRRYAEKMRERIRVRIANYPHRLSVRNINSHHTGRFVSVTGILIRTSQIESILKVAVYECPAKHLTRLKARVDHSIDEPAKCSDQKCTHRTLELRQDKSTFIDYQIMDLQERPEDMPPGKLPKTIGVFAVEDLVDSARMGDVIEMSGIVRGELSKKINLGTPVQTHRQRLHVNHIARVSTTDDLDASITKDQRDRLRAISNNTESEVTALLVNSFAPHIKGNELIKEAILYTMIGADSKTLEDGTRIRGDINMFLLGDPGTAKSEMGKAAYRVTSRSFYTSGKGSSGVGLTAATIKDNVTGAYMLEPGILVLADQGLAVIDEFDKMRPEDRSALHEVMEQQTASIAKGGITATLNARAAVIAIANPVYGRYDPFKNLTENVPSIPIPLLTRFDMIWIIRDAPQRDRDEKIAHHIITTHRDGMPDMERNSLDSRTLSQYITYSKSMRPVLSKDAEEKIIEYYMKMRSIDESETGYAITHRQLEGLVRLTIARAKFLLKDIADADDAGRAIHIMQNMFQNSSIDPTTGKVDVNQLVTGMSGTDKSKLVLFMDIMKSLTENAPGGARRKDILEEMVKSTKWPETEAEEFFKKMLRDGNLFEPTPGYYSRIP